MFEPRDRGVGGGQREEEIEVAIEDGGGWKGNPHPSFRKGRGGGGGEEQLAFPCAFSGTKPNLLLAASGGDQAWFTVLLTD